MTENKKKKYRKPEVKKIKLDAKTAVLGFCKNTGQGGPSGTGCGLPFPACHSDGSQELNGIFLTTCCKKRKVSGVPPDSGFSNKKFQITNTKYQTNHNDRNSKSQTIGV